MRTWHMPHKLNGNMDQITVICMGTKRFRLFYEFLSFSKKKKNKNKLHILYTHFVYIFVEYNVLTSAKIMKKLFLALFLAKNKLKCCRLLACGFKYGQPSLKHNGNLIKNIFFSQFKN